MARFTTRDDGNITSIVEETTHETIYPYAPVFFVEDFLGAAHDSTNRLTYRDTANATESLGADVVGGIMRLALTSANEAQLAGIDQGDQRVFGLDKNLVFEAKVRLSTLPTTGTIACVGVCGDHNAAVDTVAQSAWFRWDGATGGLITVETDDGTSETSKVTTGVTLTTADWAILRIDFSDPTDVKFFVNGERVAAGTTFNVNATPTLALQPVARIGKESSGTNVGVLDVDYLKLWSNR